MVNQKGNWKDLAQSPEAQFRQAMKILAESALHDNDPLTRKHAVYMLGNTGNPECIDTLIQALRDPEKGVRGQASQSLALFGSRASGRLVTLLKDPDWKVRYRAAETLGMGGDPATSGPLIRALSDEKDHVRYMAVKSLGELRAKEALPAIAQRCSDENPFVRRIAASVVEKFKTGEFAGNR